MQNQLEKRLLQQDINVTPKAILEELFASTDEKRCKYEEQIIEFRNRIDRCQKRINEVEKMLKHPKKYGIEDVNVHIEYKDSMNELIAEYRKEIRLICINCDILWKNELKMDKVLEYGLEE